MFVIEYDYMKCKIITQRNEVIAEQSKVIINRLDTFSYREFFDEFIFSEAEQITRLLSEANKTRNDIIR